MRVNSTLKTIEQKHENLIEKEKRKQKQAKNKKKF